MERTKKTTWNLDPKLLEKSSEHYFWELSDRGLLLVVHHIFDMKMGDPRGQFAVFRNRERPVKVTSLDSNLILAHGEILQFSLNKAFVFLQPTYHRESQIFAIPYLILDLNSFKFAFLPMQDAWRYRVEDLGSGAFRLKLDNTPQLEFPQRDGDVFRVDELEWHALEEEGLISKYLDLYPAKRILYSSEMKARKSVQIQKPFETVNAFLTDRRNYPRWAEGLGKNFRHVEGDTWQVDGPTGPVEVRFTGNDERGFHDHTVKLPDGMKVEVLLSVFRRNGSSEVRITIPRMSGASNDEFQADIDQVEHDLNQLKEILEKT